MHDGARETDERRRATATALIRKRLRETRHKEIRITTLGNVDSGKSTVLGVLTKGGLDNGRGLARAACSDINTSWRRVERPPSVNRSSGTRPTGPS